MSSAGNRPFTLGFRTRYLLRRHFQLHGVEVSATDEHDYLMRADRFLGDVPGATVRECQRRSDNATLRWDYASQEFGVLDAQNYVLTYFVVDPQWHGFPSNRRYFEYECGR